MTLHHLRSKKLGLGTAAALAVTGLGAAIAFPATANADHDGTSRGRVTAHRLAERVGPSHHVSKVDGGFSKGDVIRIDCRLPGSAVDGDRTWYLAGSGYWVSGRHVRIVKGHARRCERGSAMGTTTAKVNVRKAPTTVDGKLGTIRAGVSTVHVFCKVSGGNVGNNTFWYATAWGNGSRTGYVHSEYVDVRGKVKFCGA